MFIAETNLTWEIGITSAHSGRLLYGISISTNSSEESDIVKYKIIFKGFGFYVQFNIFANKKII